MTTTIVTVAYEGDRLGLLLQARSLGLYAGGAGLAEVIVVENPSSDGEGHGSGLGWRSELLAAYGPLAPIVRFVPRKDVAALPQAEGWWTQQVLKLEVARLVGTADYLLLDAKHHLVRPLLPSFVRNDAGQLRVRGASYAEHPLLPFLLTALRHFDLPLAAADFFPTTTPPFPLDRSVVLEIKAYAERRGDATLGEFMMREQLTEFFLYNAYLLAQGRLGDLYEVHQVPYPVVWKGKGDPRSCEALVAISRSSESPFFGVHRNAAGDMGVEAMTVLARYWEERGLMPSARAGLAHLRAMRRSQREPLLRRLGRKVARALAK